MAVSTAMRRLARASIVGAALIAVALLVLPATADAGNGASKYKYEVTQFDYQASADLTAARSEECVAGHTASWVGHAETGPSDLTDLGSLGKGSLKIQGKGTHGKFKAQSRVESNFAPAEHTLVTACDTDPTSPHYGQQTDFATTQCADGPVDSKVQGSGIVQGGVGDQLLISWQFGQVGLDGRWVPDVFRCVEAFEFSSGNCESPANLSSFTKKKFRLPFNCFVQDFTPRPGLYQYGAFTSARGFFELKRTKKR